MSDTPSLTLLKKHLAGLPQGEVATSRTLISLLAGCWHDIGGAPRQGMKAPTLAEISSLQWEPPLLSYTIQRKMPAGSQHTALQAWSLDLNHNRATCVKSWIDRQVPERPGQMNAESVAGELAEAIFGRNNDRRLRWGRDATVRVLMAKVFSYGSGSMQSVAGRRKRLREELTRLLTDRGWHELRRDVYAGPPDG